MSWHFTIASHPVQLPACTQVYIQTILRELVAEKLHTLN